MSNEKSLPESLRVVPNIPLHEQTLEQLKEEKAYWEHVLSSANGRELWVKFASKLVDLLDKRIKERLDGETKSETST